MNYYGISDTGNDIREDDKNEIPRGVPIIPLSEGIAILKEMVGEEEQEYHIHPIHLTNGKQATFHIPKNATEADIMLLISKLETIVANTINPPKP